MITRLFSPEENMERSPTSQYFWFILFQFANLTLALLLFTSGFLLKRNEVRQFSYCDSFKNIFNVHEVENHCWLPKTFDKAIFIVIDALRYDFVARNNDSVNFSFQNKLTSLTEILENKPENSVLYKFIADPPTTTLQRLKGLTTGSLPTFVDAGSNFAGSEILEDNIIHQMTMKKLNITFMGDDTWLSLFPHQFSRKFPYPSLNVKDLDTVDNGVTSHIFEELESDNWKFLIGHFLGVDHCGHTFGPYHPKMAKKLQQMDEILKLLIQSMSDDVVLFVMGDHGMTKTGDHGGDSKDELEAALFIYSPKKFTHNEEYKEEKNRHDTVAQIDLVPTISLLLDLPIPFSNLGMIIPELFNHCDECISDIDRMKYQLRVLNINALQVRTYLHSYSKVSDEFPFRKMEELEEIFQSASVRYINFSNIHSDSQDMKHEITSTILSYMEYLQSARKMCEEIWAKFDIFAMLIGVMYFSFTLLFIINMKDPSCINKLTILAVRANIFVVPLLIIVVLGNYTVTSNLLYWFSTVMVFPVAAYLLFISTLQSDEKKMLSRWFYGNYTDTFTFLFLSPFIFMVFGFFSNSYVVYEDSVTSFLLHSIAWMMFYKINYSLKDETISKAVSNKVSRPKKVKFDIGRIITSPRTVAFVICLSICFLLKLATYFRACREEQWSCEISKFMQPLSAITDDLRIYKNFRYFLSVVVLSVTPLVTIKWMKYHGNLNGITTISIIVYYILPITAVCVAFHWAMQAVPGKVLDKIPKWQQMIFAKSNYLLVTTAVVITCIKPLSIYLLPKTKNSNIPFTNSKDANIVPRMYNHIKMNWQQYLQHSNPGGNDREFKGIKGESETPVVYGLGTVYSSTILSMISVVMVLLIMLLGDGMAPGLVIQFLVMGLFLELHACCIRLQRNSLFGTTYRVPWYIIVCWCILNTHFFYSTGHQATITAIRFESAYVGFDGDFKIYIVPALLIFLNTFAAHVIGILALPLLLLWPLFRGKIIFIFGENKGQELHRKGEFILFENKTAFQKSLYHLMSVYLLASGTKVLFSMVAAGIHRRHLMVWKIFAPRFLFEGATFLFTSVMLVLVYLLVLRIDNVLSKWLKKLQ